MLLVRLRRRGRRWIGRLSGGARARVRAAPDRDHLRNHPGAIRQRFEALLEDRLNAEQAGGEHSKFEILNFSMSSYDVAQRLISFEDRALRFMPDAMIYVAGPLDVAYNHQAQMIHNRVAMPFDFLDAINAKAGVRQSMTVAEIKRRIEPFGIEIAAAGYKRLAEDARANGIQPIWIYLPGPTDDEKEVQALKAAAKAAGFTIVDLYGRYDAKLYPRTRLDPSHPSPEGHRIVAELIYNDLLGLEAAKQIKLGLRMTGQGNPAIQPTNR